SGRRRHTRLQGDWSSDVCSSDLIRSYAPLLAEGFLLREYGRILKKRTWVVVSTWLIIATLAIVYTLRTTPVFDATGRIAVNRERSEERRVGKECRSGRAQDT